jgi:succinoglycan biosynthesis transport protein ExoP
VDDALLVTVWRRRWLVLGVVVVAVVASAIVSKSLPKVYSTSSKLLVSQTQQNETFDAIQAAQVTARTYADVLSSPNIARLVADRLGGGRTPDGVDRAVEVDPVAETQLLEIKAEADTPREAKTLADAYAQVFIDYARTQLGSTTGASVTLADSAPLIESPARPKPTLYVLLTLLLAIPAGIGLALLRDRLDKRLRSIDELEEQFGVHVLASVPPRGRSDLSVYAFDEAFRVLRMGVRFAAAEGPVRTVAITSTSEGEGKTTTTINLASAAIEAGQRVLVVEADMYRANLYKRLVEEEVPGETRLERRGLAHYLDGRATLDEVIQPTPREGLTVMPAEPLEYRLSGLLEGPRGRTLAADLAERADLVLLDCPPLTVGADAAAIAARADATILVLDLGISTRNRLRQSLKQLQAAKARVLGCVINRDRAVKPADYSYQPDEERPARELEGV